MTRPTLPSTISETRLVVVARRVDRASLERLVSLGDVVFEVTMESENAAKDISWLKEAGATVGAGTVLSRDQAKDALAAGAEFLVSPYLDDDLVSWAANKNVPFAPGALTPTEITRAWKLGAAAVKIFPASVAGPQLLRELRGPLGHIPLMPTGGMHAENVASFIQAGAIAVGVGGWLTSASLDELTSRWQRLKEAVAGSQ